MGSDTPQTGTCECSNPDLNRFFQNILWSQRGNFLSVPTDCPQRDERMGWMGDAQVFAPTAAYNADVASFFAKWLVDVDDGQGPNGDFCDVSPRINRPQPGWPAWADAGVICPWIMYSAYGDKEFLAAHYPAMVRWVEYCRRNSKDFLRPAMGVGDHLNPGSRTPLDVVATAYFAHSAHLVAKSAAILGKSEDAAVYDKLFHDIADAFNQAFVAPDGKIKGDTQTAYILALQFDLLPENLRHAAAQRLAKDVEKREHLTTGFIGVGLHLPDALTNRPLRPGLATPAYRILSILALSREKRGHHHLGTLGRLDPGARIPRPGNELLQPLLPGLGRRVALLRRGRHPARRIAPRV